MKRMIFGIAVLSAMISYGQEKESEIGEVIIYDKFLQLPYKNANGNVVVISKREIENSPATSIDEVLQQCSGIDIRRRGSNGVQSDFTIRGGSFEQVMILINGIRMNDSQTGHNSMNIPVDLSNVERIEIVKGAAARRFGNNAYSGVINIVTKTSSEKYVKIAAQGGDFGTYRLGISSTFGNEKFSHLFQANTGASNGYRHNTDYHINNVFYQNQLKINNGSLQFQAGFQEKEFGANGFYASPTATEQYEEMEASVVSARLEKNFNQFKFNSSIFWRRGQDMYEYIRDKPEIYRNMHIGNNFGGEINGSYQSKLGTTGLGVELRKEYLASNNLGRHDRFISQIYFEHHFSLLNDQLKVSPGIAWADFGEQGNFFYPGMDIGFDFNGFHKIYGNIAKVNRIPTFTDLFYVSKTEQGNPNLQSESALSYEIGYRFLKNQFQAKASIFGREESNAIDWTKNNAEEIWTAENIGKRRMKGFEVELSQRFENFIQSYSLGYTFMDVEIQDNLIFSRYVLDQFKHQFVAKLENKIIGNLTNQLVYRYQERLNNQSYHLVDEKLNYRLDNLNIYLLINNLTNTKYTETFEVPMPERWFHVGFSYDIPL